MDAWSSHTIGSAACFAAVAVACFAANASLADPRESDDDEARIGGLEKTAYEEIYEFTPASRYRAAGGPVGHLVIEFTNQRNGPVIGDCTATIIDAQHILTAMHCLRDKRNPENPVKSAVLWMGFDFNKNTASPFEVVPEPVEFMDKPLDFAVLRVNGNPSANYGVALMKDAPPVLGEEMFVIHHPDGVRKQLTRRLCRARDVVDGRVRHNCHTDRGSSGGPLFSDNDAIPRLLGIHTGNEPFFGQYLNVGTPIPEIAKHSCVVHKLLPGKDHSPCPAVAATSRSTPAAGALGEVK
jgi:hypothetical protein